MWLPVSETRHQSRVIARCNPILLAIAAVVQALAAIIFSESHRCQGCAASRYNQTTDEYADDKGI